MKQGFTLIELIVVISIITILSAVTVPLYSYFQTFTVLGSAKHEVLQNIRLTQVKAQSGENNSAFGVYFDTNQYTLYQGDTYLTRNQSQDIIYGLSDNIGFSGFTEVNFSIKTGLPSATGTLTLTNTINNATETIIFNSMGLVY